MPDLVHEGLNIRRDEFLLLNYDAVELTLLYLILGKGGVLCDNVISLSLET